jgi:hypothetical protein
VRCTVVPGGGGRRSRRELRLDSCSLDAMKALRLLGTAEYAAGDPGGMRGGSPQRGGAPPGRTSPSLPTSALPRCRWRPWPGHAATKGESRTPGAPCRGSSRPVSAARRSRSRRSGTGTWLGDEIEAAGQVPQLVHARKAKRRLGMVNKTDTLDARGLTRLQRTGTLPTVGIPPGGPPGSTRPSPPPYDPHAGAPPPQEPHPRHPGQGRAPT